jgi:hypothetical protein
VILFSFEIGLLCMIIRYYDTLCYYQQNERAALLGQAPATNITCCLTLGVTTTWWSCIPF